MKNVKVLIYRLLQCSWGILQTLVGFCIFLKYRKYPHSQFHGSVRTAWPRHGGVSLGLFIFVDQADVNRPHQKLSAHEFGHTIQSLILGPLYLILIGLPSFIWFNYYKKYGREKGLSYDAFWIEKCADQLGEHVCFKGPEAM